MKLLKRPGCLLILLALPLLAVGAFAGWAYTGPGPEPAALQALESDARVQVENTRGWIVFRPAGQTPDTGLIFYPGGRVDERAYAPALRAIAQEGYLVVVVPMPLRLAVLSLERAADVQAAFPDIERWALGGHSLGGAMAARYALNHPDSVAGLALWAAYPPDGDDLARPGLKVVSVYGSLDGVAESGRVLAAAPQLPADTRWVVIEGGNHAQFGSYGPQDGDRPAAISAEAQQAAAAAATVEMLGQLR
jgi:pimeloyl-ACP methyl ester carboxylesterase